MSEQTHYITNTVKIEVYLYPLHVSNKCHAVIKLMNSYHKIYQR